MVKIKVNKVNIPEEEKYIGGIYEAFVMELDDGQIEYCTHVEKNRLMPVYPHNCEVIEEEVSTKPVDSTNKILLAEDGSVDLDDLENWCSERGIKLIVYRNGATKPEFLDIKGV